MKREEVLLYISYNRLYLYRVRKKKEVIKKINTSSFFKYGEIYDEERLIECLDKYINENFLIKPNITILFNDICNYDIKFMYKYAFITLGYNKIKFISFTDIFKNNKNYNRLIICEKDRIIDLSNKRIINDIKEASFKPIIIGNNKGNFIHYADEDYIYNTFKSYMLDNYFYKL